MEIENKVEKCIKFSKKCYDTQTPVWLIKKNGDFIGGYLNCEPDNDYCEVIDKVKKSPIKIPFSEIHVIKEYKGSTATLIRPAYMDQDICQSCGRTKQEHLNDLFNFKIKMKCGKFIVVETKE